MLIAFSGMNGGMPAESGRKTPDAAQSKEVKRLEEQRAPIAQLLLVARLRARNRRDLARDLLERAAQVIFVTCKNWFSLGRDAAVKAPVPTPLAIDTEEKPDPATALTLTESPYAHRHD